MTPHSVIFPANEVMIEIKSSTSSCASSLGSSPKTLLVQGVKKLIGELSGEDSEVKG